VFEVMEGLVEIEWEIEKVVWLLLEIVVDFEGQELKHR
jgi:hypothetical protein